MKVFCPRRKKNGGLGGGPTSPQAQTVMVCDHCHQEGHLIERCFQLHPELMRPRNAPGVNGGRGHGGRAPTAGRGGGVQPQNATAAVRIAELEKMVASLAMRESTRIGEATLPESSTARMAEPSTSGHVDSS